MSLGGRFLFDDNGETPNAQLALFQYEPGPLVIFELRNFPSGKGPKLREFEARCERGRTKLPGPAGEYRGTGKYQAHQGHLFNFFSAVRSRNVADLRADVLEGHLSTALVHMANISYRLGAEHSAEEAREAVKDRGADAVDSLGRLQEHLAANGVDFSKSRFVVGPWLEIDPRTERFLGDSPTVRRANESGARALPQTVPRPGRRVTRKTTSSMVVRVLTTHVGGISPAPNHPEERLQSRWTTTPPRRPIPTAAGYFGGTDSTNPILDDPLVAGVAHVEIIDGVDTDRGDAGGVREACAPRVVPRGRAAVLQQQLALGRETIDLVGLAVDDPDPPLAVEGRLPRGQERDHVGAALRLRSPPPSGSCRRGQPGRRLAAAGPPE